MSPVLQQVAQFLNRWISPSDALLVAVSGGADSVALLHSLLQIGISKERIVVGHVNHQLRDDSDIDESFIIEMCRENNIKLETSRIDVKRLIMRSHMSLEEAARKARYCSLESTANKYMCRWILTGHTQDDSAETVLMRVVSGAPWYECTAIPSRRGKILRPLIQIPRSNLRFWLEKSGFSFREDSSNIDPRHLRNRLRMALIGKQEFWNPEHVKLISESGQLLWWSMEFGRLKARDFIAACQENDGSIGLEIERILGYFNSLTFLPVEAAWGRLIGSPEKRFPSAIRQQVSMFLTGKNTHSLLRLPEKINVERRGPRVWIFRNHDQGISVKLAAGVNSIDGAGITLSIDRARREGQETPVAIPTSHINGALVLRTVMPGDRMKIRGRPTKKIMDLLAERGLNPIVRAKALLVADNTGPLFVLEGPIAERALPKTANDELLWVSWKTTDEPLRNHD